MRKKASKVDLTTLTLSEAASLIAASLISPVSLTEAHLTRIEQVDPALHCFIAHTSAQALETAQMAEEILRRGGSSGPLHGAPLALKDVFDLQGVPTTAGSPCPVSSSAVADSAVVQRLKEAGAVVLGKSNMYEWAMKASSDNPTFGTCNNPWNRAYTAGGSSSGSAAAVAAELCLGSLGTDTGGSTRIPAALCGVAGLKPTYGRISKRGVVPLSWSLDHVGLLARCTQDIALLLQVLAGYDPADPCSMKAAVDEYVAHLEEGVRGWHIAVAYHPFLRSGEQADEEVLKAVQEAARVFERQGATLHEVTLPYGSELPDCNSLILLSEAAAFHKERIQATPEAFSTETMESLRQGMEFPATDYVLARETRRMAHRHVEPFFGEYDILLTPTTPTAAYPHAAQEDPRKPRPSLTSFTSALNLLGLPALSLPCGFTREGLPVGLQIVGPWWAESRVLCAGSAYERATSWHERKPPLS